MTEITRWSGIETAKKIKNREVSVTEVVKAHLDQIKLVNPRINAITAVDNSALARARELDNVADANREGILFGVPVTTKINVDQAGFENTNGIPAFAGRPCKADSAVVANLKSENAIVIGRTNTPEFSMRWCTSNPLHGVTHNPWHPDITPGGSSGAAAAAVASGIGAIAHGNDLGGSLRYPAYCCGVAAIRPSLGRVPAYNPAAVVERPPITQLMSVQGPIARTIGDVRQGLKAMSKRSPNDPLWTSAPDSGRMRSGKVKIGFNPNPFSHTAEDAVQSAVRTASDALRYAGHELIEYSPPKPDEAARLWGELLFTETTAMMSETILENGSPEMNRLFDTYQEIFGSLDVKGLLNGLSERRRIQRAWANMFEEIDVMLMPTSLILPFENDLDFKSPERIPEIVAAQAPLFVVNLLGLPSVAVPLGFHNGIPVGIQIIGPMHDDAFVLDIAEELEKTLSAC
jgi:amidase